METRGWGERGVHEVYGVPRMGEYLGLGERGAPGMVQYGIIPIEGGLARNTL